LTAAVRPLKGCPASKLETPKTTTYLYLRQTMSKILAIDFGLKRTGLAITDDSKTFAFGLDTVESKLLMNVLKSTVLKDKVDTIVLGEPKRLDTSDSHITQNVHQLLEVLKKQFPNQQVLLFDERFTSKMASHSIHLAGGSKKMKGDKGLIDKVSATILLQSYLSAQAI
jgi:putative Holliday junction resolvase